MKAVVLTAYIPGAGAVQIGSQEVQISTAGQTRRGWEKFPEYRKQGKHLLQARGWLEQTSVGGQEAWVLVLALAPHCCVTSGEAWSPSVLIVPGGQQKTLLANLRVLIPLAVRGEGRVEEYAEQEELRSLE